MSGRHGGPRYARLLPAVAGGALLLMLALVACAPGEITPAETGEAGPTAEVLPTVTAEAAPTATAEELAAELEEQFTRDLSLAPALSNGPGIEGVRVFPVQGPDERALWVAHTLGLRSSEPEQKHAVAIYERVEGTWQELDRIEPSQEPVYLSPESVYQVEGVTDQTWIAVEGGAGAHSGTFDLLAFDGMSFVPLVGHFHGSPGAARIEDLDGDEVPEVILNFSDAYIFCYACGVWLPYFEIQRLEEGELRPVELRALPEGSPEALQTLNGQAVALAEAGLWQEAARLIREAIALDEESKILQQNALLIEYNARRAAEMVAGSRYPLLMSILAGDLEGALDEMRGYAPQELFGPESALVVGTVAEGYKEVLNQLVVEYTTEAINLEVEPAAAHFLHGWGLSLVDPTDPQILAHVELALQLAPDEPLFAESLSWLPESGTPSEVDQWFPIPPEACEELRAGVTGALQLRTTLIDAPFEDYISDTTGQGCSISAAATGAEVEDFSSVASSLADVLTQLGWTRDPRYNADGPTGTAAGFRKQEELCLLQVGWEPAPETECPEDQPIHACNVPPEQQMYEIRLICAGEVQG